MKIRSDLKKYRLLLFCIPFFMFFYVSAYAQNLSDFDQDLLESRMESALLQLSKMQNNKRMVESVKVEIKDKDDLSLTFKLSTNGRVYHYEQCSTFSIKILKDLYRLRIACSNQNGDINRPWISDFLKISDPEYFLNFVLHKPKIYLRVDLSN